PLSRFTFCASAHEGGPGGRIVSLTLSRRPRRQKSADAERGKSQLALRYTPVAVNIERPVEGVDARLFSGIYYHDRIAPIDDRAAEDGHINVGQSFQAAPERIEIPLDKAQLIQRARPPYRLSSGPEASRRSLDDLQETARSLPRKGVARVRVEQRFEGHDVQQPGRLRLEPPRDRVKLPPKLGLIAEDGFKIAAGASMPGLSALEQARQIIARRSLSPLRRRGSVQHR